MRRFGPRTNIYVFFFATIAGLHAWVRELGVQSVLHLPGRCGISLARRELGRRRPIWLNMQTEAPRKKRGILKTADRCDKGECDSTLSNSTPTSFASHPSSSLTLSPFVRPPHHPPHCLTPYFCPLSTCSASLPTDDCPRNLCSVCQMSYSRNWNINLAVNIAEEWRGRRAGEREEREEPVLSSSRNNDSQPAGKQEDKIELFR